MIPRPVRNNNPGDIRKGAPWKGLVPDELLTPEQREDDYCVFDTPENGFRALVLLLRNYGVIFRCDTINEIITRFAPKEDHNPTAIYAAHVARDCGVGAGQPFDVTTRDNIFKLAKSVTHFETGSWAPYWNDDQLNMGIGLTGLYPTAKVAA